ncbi:MAG: ACP S-malonyltransferase [Burkholderiaceae bacterium]
MKLAFVFPGQGSQSVGMLESFGANAAVQATLVRASAALGQDLAALIQTGPSEDLNLTVNTQPAMLVAAFAMYEAWRAAGGRVPDLMAGHSLGEYTALTAAGALELETAVKLVRFRAQAMQTAVPVGQGGMAAILGLDDDAVRAACAAAAQGDVVEPVNYNAPAQVVIAGSKAAVERACEEAKKLGAKRALTLPVSAPFHSSLLAPASEQLRAYLAGVSIAAPQVPVINNVDVAIESDPARIADALARQAAAPVQWVRTVLAMQSQGVTHMVECGPGKVLTGLAKRIAPELVAVSIADAASLEAALIQFKD